MNANFSPTIRQLRAFLAVYQLKKLSAAAQRLFVTQSAVSMLIRQLEEGLDTRLFDRTTRSLKATAAAEQMMVTVERILRDVDSLSNDFRELAALERGRVTLAITPTLAAFLLPDAMRAFNEQHPGVRVLVNDCAPDQFVSRIIGEHVDFGIGTPERPGAEVEVQRLMRDHLALVCREDHPLAKSRVVRWSDLAGHPLITVRPGYGVRPLIDGTAAEAGVALDVVNEVSFLSTAIWMTAAGMGASIMPSAFARAEADPSLVIKVLSSPRVARDISIVTKRGHSLSAAARAFVEALKRSL
ncbi:LysR family transcriptional regulator [Variovorax atrisoli]|uniref:LysR family transcriptional regulator n=1 Tax=Variovorax atrisoli TaxID=3394203 RepID=UPI000F7E9079|nr:LysR family transcriptional regulator [Variovorax sp. 369]RTD91006.1 LysR family transcriptional regulator [Variovorax sp. 369]